MRTTKKLRSKYPVAIKRCHSEAIKYGRCVTISADLKAGECEKEFRELNRCFQEALKTLK